LRRFITRDDYNINLIVLIYIIIYTSYKERVDSIKDLAVVRIYVNLRTHIITSIYYIYYIYILYIHTKVKNNGYRFSRRFSFRIIHPAGSTQTRQIYSIPLYSHHHHRRRTQEMIISFHSSPSARPPERSQIRAHPHHDFRVSPSSSLFNPRPSSSS